MGEKASFTGREADRTDTVARQEHADSADLTEVSGAIKWFDVAKGYGFILPDEPHLGDILLHVTCLRRDGFQTALEGARVVCLARQGDRGMQAFRVISMDTSTAVHPAEMQEQRTHVSVTPESGLERARRVQAALAQALGSKPMVPAPETLICRCEGRSYADLQALADDASVREIRLMGRFGLGACQGRFCGPMIAALRGRPVPAASPPRWPLRPVSVAALARLSTDETE